MRRPTQLLVVSGSNMSGKSTLLRTVGINTVSPSRVRQCVRARCGSRRSPWAPRCVSRTRCRKAGRGSTRRSRAFAKSPTWHAPTPLLFLLDELFHGTNSHDRLVGSSGVLRSLLDRGAIGLITTHDLALTGIAERVATERERALRGLVRRPGAAVDYRLKTGPVTRSNAIALMRAVGLDVPEEQ